MFITFLKLQWKSFVRGESVGADITTKIFKWFWIVYFAFIIPALGFLTYDVIERKFRDRRPFSIYKQTAYLCFRIFNSTEVLCSAYTCYFA